MAATSFKSLMSPENSVVAGLAVVGLVYANYQLHVGPVSMAYATPDNSKDSRNLEAQRKKAGWSSLGLVAGVSLLARDPNILILGGATILAMEASYRHAILCNPDTGQIVPAGPAAYQPAGNVTPLYAQGQPG